MRFPSPSNIGIYLIVNFIVFTLLLYSAHAIGEEIVQDEAGCLDTSDGGICRDSIERVPEIRLGGMDRRAIVIGDVHGSAEGLLELLFTSNITAEKTGTSCSWREQPFGGTLLVQIGDIVDRGENAYEAWTCLEDLQRSAPAGSEVIRILGNHELWWLQGRYHMRNPQTDTLEKVRSIVLKMKESIMKGEIKAAHLLKTGKADLDIVFVHAGIRPEMFRYFQDRLGSDLSATSEETLNDRIVNYMNELLVRHTISCPGFGTQCAYNDEVFEAGPDRGGSGIGGPLWTDYSLIEKSARLNQLPPNVVQIVGHTVSSCYRSYRGEEDHPPDDFAPCKSEGIVRPALNSLSSPSVMLSAISSAIFNLAPGSSSSTNQPDGKPFPLSAVCVDSGMYLGARGFLEILLDSNSFLAHEKSGHTGLWKIKDLALKLL